MPSKGKSVPGSVPRPLPTAPPPPPPPWPRAALHCLPCLTPVWHLCPLHRASLQPRHHVWTLCRPFQPPTPHTHAILAKVHKKSDHIHSLAFIPQPLSFLREFVCQARVTNRFHLAARREMKKPSDSQSQRKCAFLLALNL